MRTVRVVTSIMLGLFALAGSLSALAETGGPGKGQVFLSPGAVYLELADERDLEQALGFGIGLGYMPADNWGLEATFIDANPGIDDGSTRNVDFQSYRLDGLYFPWTYEHWDPYVSAGVGRTDVDYGNSALRPRDEEETNTNLGIGVFTAINNWLSFRADARAQYGFDTEQVEGIFTFGVTALVGNTSTPARARLDSDNDGVYDENDRCPGTPAGTTVDADGCTQVLDRDGDGVPDSADRCPNTPRGVAVDSRGCERDDDGDGVKNRMDKCPNTPAGVRVDSSGCEIKAPVTINLTVLFDTDKSVIRSTHIPEVDDVVKFLKANPASTATIEGHTDSRGAEAYNQALSERRAYAVRDYLIRNAGVAPRRLEARGYGESRPVASNDTSAGRQQNRRVTAVVTSGR